MRASAGFAVTKRPSTVVWKIPSTAFSKMPRYFSSASRRSSSARRRAESRHGVVCDHEVPLPLIESGLHGPRGVDPLADGVVAATPQLPQEEQGVVFVVLDEQHS